MKFKFSVIIPTLNEEYFLARNLEQLISSKRNLEIIVSDGGSKDSTLEIAKKFKCKIVQSKAGRGTQLNAGAAVASGDILIFLHADTFLPSDAIELIEKTFSDTQVSIARFKLGFDFTSKCLEFYKSFTKYNSQFTRFGDSAIIVRKDFFKELGGFSDRETFEDVDFFSRAAKYSKIYLIDDFVISSARRFILDGEIKRQLLNILLFTAYLLNFNQKFLSKMYSVPKKKRNNSLIIFLRYPENGNVKTRLAKTTSYDFATSFYKTCAERIINEVKEIKSINRFAFYSNKDEKTKVEKWLGSKLFFSPQEGKSLGERMQNAFAKVFSSGAKKVVIVGTDVPDLSAEIIREAFNKLDESDVVIGPSKDGGYYLLGMKKLHNQLFEDIEFSTAEVYSETVSRLKNFNLTYHILPELQDIDTEEDLINWLNGNNKNDIRNEIKLAYEAI